MKNIYLVRHGESLSNAGSVAVRNAKIPLTEKGKQQAQAVADWLIQHVNPIDNIFVSKFIRTHQTAQPLVTLTDIQPTIIDGIQEFNYVAFSRIDGLAATERRKLSAQYWQTATPDYIDGDNDSDVESFEQLQARMTQAIDYFQALLAGNYVVYTHGLWLSALLWRLLGLPTHDQASMKRFRQFEQAIRIQNGEVFQWQHAENSVPAITKVRAVTDNLVGKNR